MAFETLNDIMINLNINAIKSTAIAMSSNIMLITMNLRMLRSYEMTFMFDNLANRVKSIIYRRQLKEEQIRQKIRQSEDSINFARH